MQKRKAREPSQQNRTPFHIAFSYKAAVPALPKGSVVHMRYNTPTETASNLVAPMLQLGGEGKGPPKEILSQDLNPKLWAWFDNNCSTYGFVPLHRKEDYLLGKGDGKRRDVQKPDLCPIPDHVAYRYRSCNNFSEKQEVKVSRHVLQDSDEFFIEALTQYHLNRWFEVIGRDGELLSPQDSVHLKVSRHNAMEEDHSCSIIDSELRELCQRPYSSDVDGMLHSANDDSFYDEVQEQLVSRKDKMERYRIYKRNRQGMLALTAYLVNSFKPKYVGPPGLPIPEVMKETARIEKEMYLVRHSACKITVPLDTHPLSFIGYEIGSETPYYNNRLRLMGVTDYVNRHDQPLLDATVGVRKAQYRRLQAVRNKAAVKGLSTYLSSLKATHLSTRWKFKNVPSIVKFLNYIDSLYKKITVGVISEVIDKHESNLQYATPVFETPYFDGHMLYQKLMQSEVDGVAKVAAKSIERVEENKKTQLPDTKWVDNLDLFRSRTKSFTKQVYIEPDDIDSLNKNVILTFNKEGTLSADQAIIKEVASDRDLYNKVIDQHQHDSTCPTCGKV